MKKYPDKSFISDRGRPQLILLLLILIGSIVSTGAAQTTAPKSGAPSQTEAVPAVSEAERIIGVRALLESDRAWRLKLTADLDNTQKEYNTTLELLVQLDKQLRSNGGATSGVTDASTTDEQVAAIIAERTTMRDRVDRLIQRRKALRQQLQVLDEKIALLAQILDDLVDGRPPSLKSATKTVAPDKPAEKEEQKTRPPAIAIPGFPQFSQSSDSAKPQRPDDAPDATIDDGPVVDAHVLTARAVQSEAKSAHEAAVDGLALVDRAISIFTRDLESARQVQTVAKAEVDAASALLTQAEGKLQNALTANEPDLPQIAAIKVARDVAAARIEAARADVKLHRQRIAASEAVIKELDILRENAAATVATTESALANTEKKLAFVQGPFAPHKLWQWVLNVGPRIVLIIVLMIVLRWLAGLIARRVVRQVIKHGRRGSQASREERAETLSRVFRSTSIILILVLGTLAILNQAGMNVTVLLGGAAVFGAAIAFGSQNLIKDYFSGFMVLLENQYSVGNVIRIGETSGTVEDITLRMTVLRDLEGIVHFVPHSQITTVSNMTFGWSRALFDIGVSYNEDVNKVMEVLMQLAREMRDDEVFGTNMLDEPEMLGVNSFDDSAVTIRFFIKTRPLKQWIVRREMLRRIKMRFDELGIEIPFPHRTVYHRGLNLPQATEPSTEQ